MQRYLPMLCGTLLLVAALLLTAKPADALSCAPRRYDANEAQQMFGPSELVFIGHLEQLGVVRNEAWYASAVGMFTPGEVFKGKPDGTPSIRVNANLIGGHDYLVFARRDDSGLRADGACSAGTEDLAIPSPFMGEQLSWLRSLPAPGSGGNVDIYLREDSARQMVEGVTLTFEGSAGTFSVRTDKDGGGHVTSVGAGTYRLVTDAPVGFRYTCYPNCESLIVHDRGREEVAVFLQARAKLKMEIVDAAGQPVNLRAQFELFEPDSGHRTGSRRWQLTNQYLNDEHVAAMGELPPGRYVVGLVLPEFDADDLSPKVTDNTVIFDHGVAQLQLAPVIDVHEGDNVARFHLPKVLQPVRNELNFSGERFDQSIAASGLQLLLGEKIGGWSSDVNCRLDGDDGEASRTFWSLPGQTLRLNAYGYLIDGHKNTLRLRPLHDGVIDLQLLKQ